MPIPRQSAFENHRFDLLRAFRSGATIELAAEQTGVAVNTLRRWLTNGRNHPEGMYGKFAQDVDRIRDGTMDAVWLARDFVDALRHVSQVGDDAGPELGRVYDRISALPSPDRGRFEVEIANHLIVAVLKLYPIEVIKEATVEGCFEAFWDFVDEYYELQESKGRR